MRNKLYKLIIICLFAACLGNALNAQTPDVTLEGQCGDSLYWKIADSTLSIFGTGTMYDYKLSLNFTNLSMVSTAPWFADRSSFNSLAIEEGITSIGNFAFYQCTSITDSLIIPNSIDTIGKSAFYMCSNLYSTLIIPESVTTIEDNAFSFCAFRGPLNIPNSVTTIGKDAFSWNYGFTALTLPNNITSIKESTFQNCANITGTLTLPEELTTIEKNAFYGCDSLTGSLIIPNGVTKIEESAFQNCSNLNGILSLPESIDTIGKKAFAGCSSFASIYCYAENLPQADTNNFIQCPSDMVIYVPRQSVDAYKATSPWNKFTVMSLSYIVTAVTNPEEAGIITGADTYNLSDTVTLTATANEGYKFINWTENDSIVSEDTEYTFVITSDRNLVANFELLTYEVIVSVNIENAGIVITDSTYNHGDTVSLTATANEGYKFINWTENDSIVSEDTEYTFVITSDRNLVANFELLEEPGEEPEDSTLLAAPTNLRATIRQDVPGFNYKFEITMMWDAVVGAKGYDIYVNTADTTGFHMGYTNGTAYVAGTDKEATLEFYVVAFNDSIDSKPSEPCTITIVDDAIEELEASFNIYPNPANDKLYIETPTMTQTPTMTVEIYDVYGRQQTTDNGQQLSCIDVSNLNSGVYFVKVVTSKGEIVKRFIKK